MEHVLIVMAVLFSIGGILGSILPLLPGPPLSYLALLFLQGAKKGTAFSTGFLVLFGMLTLISLVLDYILPLIGAKWYGVSRYGMTGSLTGMLAGMFLFPPLGIILGVFTGAVIGELIAGKDRSKALQAGLVTFISNVISFFLKLSLSVIMAFYLFLKLI
ncbi:MAG: DUF456 domain-containing protein [bacterium]|nr:DUF456 domain-containing protein [bacterium]